jgi:hypothetical protein
MVPSGINRVPCFSVVQYATATRSIIPTGPGVGGPQRHCRARECVSRPLQQCSKARNTHKVLQAINIRRLTQTLLIPRILCTAIKTRLIIRVGSTAIRAHILIRQVFRTVSRFGLPWFPGAGGLVEVASCFRDCVAACCDYLELRVYQRGCGEERGQSCCQRQAFGRGSRAAGSCWSHDGMLEKGRGEGRSEAKRSVEGCSKRVWV